MLTRFDYRLKNKMEQIEDFFWETLSFVLALVIYGALSLLVFLFIVTAVVFAAERLV